MLRCLPNPKSRGLRNRTARWPPTMARETKLAPRNPANISGNKVTISTRTRRPPASGPLDAFHRTKGHERRFYVHAEDDAFYKWDLPCRSAVHRLHEQRVG